MSFDIKVGHYGSIQLELNGEHVGSNFRIQKVGGSDLPVTWTSPKLFSDEDTLREAVEFVRRAISGSTNNCIRAPLYVLLNHLLFDGFKRPEGVPEEFYETVEQMLETSRDVVFSRRINDLRMEHHRYIGRGIHPCLKVSLATLLKVWF